jgi:recombination protein U
MKNKGKVFENNFRLSIPKTPNVFYYRLKDTASSYYGGNEFLRFSQSNIADAFLLNTSEKATHLLILELKNHKGKSLPYNAIRENQLNEMLKASEYNNVVPLLIVFFIDIERCFSLHIVKVMKFIQESERKSIPIEYFEEEGTEIEVIKLRTNYRYNIEKFLEEY